MRPPNVSQSPRGTVLLLSLDRALIDAVRPPLAGLGLTLEAYDEPAALSRRVTAAPPESAHPCALLVVDLRAFPSVDDLIMISSDCCAGQPGLHLPLICLGQGEDLQQRLTATRVGAVACLPVAIEAQVLAARLATLAGTADGAPERVLVVDDQPVAALFASRVLTHAGMVAEPVHDPLQVLAAMDRFAPDLILMDLHMPGINGIELTGVIREQARFADLPIIFLSAELDQGRQLDALRIGGDDFLAKPVAPERLVACVRQRLVRARHRARVQRAAVQAPPTVRSGRERLLARLDDLLRAQSKSHWALVYFEQPGDATVMTRLVAAVGAHAGAAGLTAQVGEHGVATLVPGTDERDFPAIVQTLGLSVQADLQAVAGGAAVPLGGVGWCSLTVGGGESVTLVSRARKAARSSLDRQQGRCEGYAWAPTPPRADQTTDPRLAAILAGQFQLLFQPMVPLCAVAAERYEATLRLCASDGELLAPSVFAPLVRRAGQVVAVDRWLFLAGLDALRVRRAAGRPVELLLHQSCASLAAPTWIDWVRDEISARDLIASRPVIQLQVADVDRHLDLAVSRAGQLGTLGLRLCLNGLAEGAPGERVLARLPVAFVRLARAATQGPTRERLATLVASIHARRARVIVTGVDAPDAIAPLLRAGVDLIQGGYVQPPTESMEFDFADMQAG
ncbi:MAG TPA: EAL domain-containing protein [Lamprocystis sp. (in: g-proteobacteria)]|nr:EAL domain-containing protein [Lamprocystis sp. (in: g-proteobacteria)]